MKCRYVALLIVPLLFSAIVAEALASVEWTPGRAFKLEKSPLDVAFSADGRWVFVLTDEGSLLVHSAKGKLVESL